MRTKEQDPTIIKWDKVVAFGSRNNANRKIEIPRSNAMVLYSFLKDYVHGDEERLKFLSGFCGIEDLDPNVVNVEISRRKINRIAEIFHMRIEDGEKLPFGAEVVSSALLHLDDVFIFSGGNVSFAFRKKMSEISNKAGVF